ncbi:MAG TPA: glycoside hydrolase family 13 protein [Actinomycetes bacterium]|nr:glycoside hydrolase family 13 protein [Actinomycetes bacterium]
MTPAPWWRDAVIYQVYIRSFADSDGDGVGDLPGIHSRLGYLSELGVDALWITPFYPSPMADGGYDVADYRDVEPVFGTLADFDAMLSDAHALGLRVIIDIVPNHTSEAHAWFQAALAAGPGSQERERYVFRDGRGPDGSLPPSNWPSVFGGSAWTRVPDGQWYLHLFTPEQPDLNWALPEVREEFHSILRFWLDRGVDGFRIDVAHGLAKDHAEPLRDLDLGQTGLLDAYGGEDNPLWDREDVHDIYRGWHEVLASYPGDRMSVAEAWVNTPERRARYLRPDELSQAFNFDFLKSEWAYTSLRQAIEAELATVGLVGAAATWVLANHDVRREVTRYGDGELGQRRARAAALLLLALPGSAYVYQGEELGLPEVLDLPDEVRADPVFARTKGERKGRDGCRVPLPWWGSEAPYGFGPDGSRPWLPQPSTWADLSVEAQAERADSMLVLYRNALALRQFIAGETALTWVEDLGPDVLAFRRGDGFLCLVNLGTTSVAPPNGTEVLLSSDPAYVAAGPIAPDTAAWLRT